MCIIVYVLHRSMYIYICIYTYISCIYVCVCMYTLNIYRLGGAPCLEGCLEGRLAEASADTGGEAMCPSSADPHSEACPPPD